MKESSGTGKRYPPTHTHTQTHHNQCLMQVYRALKLYFFHLAMLNMERSVGENNSSDKSNNIGKGVKGKKIISWKANH